MVTAQRLGSSRIVCGLSNKLSADEQAKLTGDAWSVCPNPAPGSFWRSTLLTAAFANTPSGRILLDCGLRMLN